MLDSFVFDPFKMDIPHGFQDDFFSDRHKVVAATQKYSQAHGQTDGNLVGLKGGVLLWGASTIEENYLLEKLVEKSQPKVVVEIGLYRGQTALTLNRALQKHCRSSRYFGFDVSPAAVEITNSLLLAEDLKHPWKLALEAFRGTLPDNASPDLALIDGDHSYEGAARDLVGIYNLCQTGGLIAIHDIGCPNWAFTHQPPGALFHQAFPKLAKNNASIAWLDSMCRDLTMKMLSPKSNARHHYTDNVHDAATIGAMTMKDTVEGWGGMGLIEKTNGGHRIELAEALASKPVDAAPKQVPPPRKSVVSRGLRKLSEMLP